MDGSPQQATESQPPQDLLLLRNPAYEITGQPQCALEQEQTQILRNPAYETTGQPQCALVQEQTQLLRNPAYETTDQPQCALEQEQTQLLRNPAYEETNPQCSTEQEYICQQGMPNEAIYAVIPLTPGQIPQEEGSQYNVLNRSMQVNNTPIGANTIPEETESKYSTLQ